MIKAQTKLTAIFHFRIPSFFMRTFSTDVYLKMENALSVFPFLAVSMKNTNLYLKLMRVSDSGQHQKVPRNRPPTHIYYHRPVTKRTLSHTER